MAGEKFLLTGQVGDVDGEQAAISDLSQVAHVRLNELGQVDVAMEIDGERTQLTQGLDSLYDLLERGLSETRGRMVRLQEGMDLLVVEGVSTAPPAVRAIISERPAKPPDQSGWTCCGYTNIPEDERTHLVDAILALAQTMKTRTGRAVGWECPVPFAVALADLMSSRIPPLNAINAAVGRERQAP